LEYFSIVLSNLKFSLPAEADRKNKMLVLALQFSRCDVTHAELVVGGRRARRSGVGPKVIGDMCRPTPSKRKRRR
jgi:hypothetical protein